jgi:hypothetical protein
MHIYHRRVEGGDDVLNSVEVNTAGFVLWSTVRPSRVLAGRAVRIMQNSEAVNKRAVDSEMKHTDVVENVAQSES